MSPSSQPPPGLHTATDQTLTAPAGDDALRITLPASASPGLVGGRYELRRLLGEGGMGSVWEARDRALNEVVALKLLRPRLALDAAALERFRQEVRLARRVTHPNVVRTFDFGEHPEGCCITMEFVDGRSLAHDLQARGARPASEATAIARAALCGLAAAHAAGVIHRDLKPENVLLARDGRVMITDFGIARGAAGTGLETGGHLVGTPAYMAPEQIDGASTVDARADVYALGEILYELLTGERAWPEDSVMALLNARLTRPPPDPRARAPVDDGLAEFVLRCMAPREGRYADAGVALTALDAATRATAAGDRATTAAASGERRAAAPAVTTPPPVEAIALAVLPITNLGPAEDQHLADGITEDLTDTLSTLRGLRVRPRSTAARAAREHGDPSEAGGALGVSVVVEGSLRRTATGVRLSARVLGVADGFQVWAQRFDRPLAELLVVADEAARAIAEALHGMVARPVRRALSDPEAVELFFRARQKTRECWHVTDGGEALALYAAALERAPDDPVILAACAAARSRWASGPEARDLARSLAERAIAAAPDNPEAWNALATVHEHDGDVAARARALRGALACGPRSALAHHGLGRWLAEVGPLTGAIAHLEQAVEAAPDFTDSLGYLAMAYFLAGDPRGVEAITRGFELRADHAMWIGTCARNALCRRLPAMPFAVPEGSNGPFRYARVISELLAGETTHAGAIVRVAEVEGTLPARFRAFVQQLTAEVAGHGHMIDACLRALARSADAGLIDVVWLDRCPLLDAARASPDFAAVRARVAERAHAIRSTLAHERLISPAWVGDDGAPRA
jgi:serine/threonine protein kinase/tetratricopeptide (TPR) repeat protein